MGRDKVSTAAIEFIYKMKNDKFEPIHLVQRKISTPLFRNAREALGGASPASKQPLKYLVIDSTAVIPEAIFFNAPVCPVFIHGNKSYIYLQGECLSNYFLARKHKDIVLTEEEIWKLLAQISKALLVLREAGAEHPHLKEYAVRRVNEDSFRLIYHPAILTPLQLIDDNQARWYQFYFAPEQLGSFSAAEANSCVFSLAATVLNIMNPLDSKRDIYSAQNYQLSNRVIEEKLKNAGCIYSSRLVEIVRLGLQSDYKKRISLEELVRLLAKQDPLAKKNKQIEEWKSSVSARMSKSKEKKKSPPKQQQQITHMINFERGTFGGETEVSHEDEQSQIGNDYDLKSEKQLTYNEYYQNKKGDKSKPIEKSPSAPMWGTTSKSPQQSAETLNVGDSSVIVSIIEDEKQRQVVTYDINEFNQRVCEYHIKISQCLQPLEDIIKQIGGQATWIGEDLYYGALINGRRNGVGLELFPNREYYYGHFKDDLFHGEGFYFWHNAQYFLGLWQAGNKVQGTWQGKAKYVGQIKHNRRHGIGSCFYPSGKTYIGQWYDGKYQGSGILTEPSGQKFIGLFRGGKKWGKGYFLADKCRITGIWDGDKALGSVEINYENGDVFIGMINPDFQKQGEGEYRFKNGAVSKGTFEHDQLISGQVLYRNGDKYVGEMRDFKRHGYGKYFAANGRIREGKWVDGRFEGSE